MMRRYMFMMRTTLSITFVEKLDTWHPDAGIDQSRVQSIPSWLTQKNPKIFGYLRKMLFLLQMSLITGSKCLSWYLDNGCSQNMIRERCMFQCLTPHHGVTVTFKENQKGKITGVGKIVIHPTLLLIMFYLLKVLSTIYWA